MVSDVRPKLGERIKWYRQRAGLTQRALADALKADKATVWRAEQGEAWPDYKTLEAMASVLGVDLEAFFAWGIPAETTPQEALEVIARELHRAHERTKPAGDPLAEKLAKLGPDARRAIEAMVDGALLQEAPKHDGKASEKGK